MTDDSPNLPLPVNNLRSLPTFSENPFVDGVGYNTRKRREVVYDGRQAVLNTETGEIEDQLALARIRTVDADQFVKVYLEHLWMIFDLSRAAQRVAEFLFLQIGRRSLGRGEVLIAYQEYEQHFAGRQGGTRSTFMRGLSELAGKRLIAKSPIPNVWWINPAVAFNGDRARFITEIRREKTPGAFKSLDAAAAVPSLPAHPPTPVTEQADEASPAASPAA